MPPARPTAANIDHIADIAVLRSLLESVSNTLDHMQTDMREMRDAMTTLKAQDVVGRLDRLEARVVTLERLKEQGTGALTASKVLWVIMAGAAGIIGAAIHWVTTQFQQVTPP